MVLKNSDSGIYTITNIITKQIYVGYASNIQKRLGNHKRDLLLNRHDNKRLQESYNIYSIINFKFETLEFYDKEYLTSMEHYWCNLLDSHNENFGFNIQKTNPNATCLSLLPKHLAKLKQIVYIPPIKIKKPRNLNRVYKPLSDETKLKMSIAHRGKKLSETTKQKLSISNRGRKMTPEHKAKLLSINLGKKQSLETIDERRQSMFRNNKTKVILQYDLNENFIKEWKSGSQIERDAGLKRQTIVKCCLKQRKTAFKFIWKYKE